MAERHCEKALMRTVSWISMTALAEIRHHELGKFSIRVSQFLLEGGTLSFKGTGIYFKYPVEKGNNVKIRLIYQMKAGGLRSVATNGVVLEGQKGVFTIQMDPLGRKGKAIQELSEQVSFIKKSGGAGLWDGLSILR